MSRIASVAARAAKLASDLEYVPPEHRAAKIEMALRLEGRDLRRALRYIRDDADSLDFAKARARDVLELDSDDRAGIIKGG